MVDDTRREGVARPHWAHFRALVIARYGLIPEEGAGEPYRDPEIYRDMQHRRYQSFVAD